MADLLPCTRVVLILIIRFMRRMALWCCLLIPGVAPATAENITYAAASSAEGFTATATANIDQDGTLDQWYVNDRKTGLEFATTDDVIL